MTPPGHEAELARRMEDFDQFFADLISRRRQRPGGDVVSALLNTSDAGRLSEENLRSLVKLLLIAANETTKNLMSNAGAALLVTAGLQERLRGEPRLCRAWVEEALRFDAPVQIVLRRTQLEVEFDGVRIPEGQVVAAILGSANRDERRRPIRTCSGWIGVSRTSRSEPARIPVLVVRSPVSRRPSACRSCWRKLGTSKRWTT